MKKLHARFLRVDPHDRESYHCVDCDKIRAICRDCDSCNECCKCSYCPVCGLPDDFRGECTCFQCASCHEIKPENESHLDNFKYDTDELNPSEPYEEVCEKCYNKRVAAWKKQVKSNN